jgi:hypothetical protein
MCAINLTIIIVADRCSLLDTTALPSLVRSLGELLRRWIRLSYNAALYARFPGPGVTSHMNKGTGLRPDEDCR